MMNFIDISTCLALTTYEMTPEGEGAAAAVGIMAVLAAMMVPILILMAIYIISMWKIFTKAGQPGWAAIVPIYNIIVQLNVQGRPTWWIIWYLVPFVNYVTGLVMFIITGLDLAKRFGKSGGFAAGLILLNPIFLLILAFGGAQYQGAAAASALPAPPADPPAAPPAAPPAEGA